MGENRVKRWLNPLLALVLVALLVGLYKAKTDAGKTRAQVRELEAQVESVEADVRGLRADIAKQESPEAIEDLAAKHLEQRAPMHALPESEIDARLPPPKNRERE